MKGTPISDPFNSLHQAGDPTITLAATPAAEKNAGSSTCCATAGASPDIDLLHINLLKSLLPVLHPRTVFLKYLRAIPLKCNHHGRQHPISHLILREVGDQYLSSRLRPVYGANKKWIGVSLQTCPALTLDENGAELFSIRGS